MSRMETPFVVTVGAVVVSGGHLKEPWLVDAKLVDNKHFIRLSKGDRKLAKAVGFDVKQARSWWPEGSFIQIITQLRDDAVDELIHNHFVDDDPMADSQQASPQKVNHLPRPQLFETAKVEQVIEITYPAFTASDGARVPSHMLRVISTPRKGGAVTMELTAENMQLIAMTVGPAAEDDVADGDGDEPNVRTDGDEPDTHFIINEPNVRWAKRSADSAWVMSCSYRAGTGKWKTHSKVPNFEDDDELNDNIMRQTAAKVQEFYRENHVHAERPQPAP
jgi:hypothetical protein